MKRFFAIATLLLGVAAIVAGLFPLGAGIYMISVLVSLANSGIPGDMVAHDYYINDEHVSGTTLYTSLFGSAAALFALGGGLLFFSRFLWRARER